MENVGKLPQKRKDIKAQIWKTNPNMELDFIALCNESTGLYGYKGSSLKSWANVIVGINTKYNQQFDHKALKNKWDALKSAYVTWRTLTHKTGHGQNIDGTFNWSNEIWEAEIQKNKNVARFRFEPLRHFKELEQLFEGLFASGDDEYIATVGDKVELDNNAMNIDGDGDVDVGNSQFVDIENDAYFASQFDASPGHPPGSPAQGSTPIDPSPAQGSTPRESSPAQGSTPVSNKSSGNTTRLGKRKVANDDIVELTEIIQSHVASTQSNREVLLKKMEMEEEMMRRRIDIDEEMCRRRVEKDKLKEERALKTAIYSMEECCKVIDALKDIPEVYLDKKIYLSAKMALSASYELRVAFMTEREVEDKIALLELMAKK